MRKRSGFWFGGVIILSCFSILLAGGAHSASPDEEVGRSERESSTPEGEKGYQFLGFRISREEGLHLEGPWQKIKLQIRGSAKLDAGRLIGDDQIGRAFTDFNGQDSTLRSLRADFLTKFFDLVEWKLVFEFAYEQQVTENWIGLTKKIPFLGYVRAGYMKEPFSLEELTGWTNLTFMEKALPTWIFAAGANLGIQLQNTAWDERLNWSLGGFWNVQAANTVGDARDQIDKANGYDLTMRLSGLPWYQENGQKLLHLGMGYSHRFPTGGDQSIQLRYKARPETYLTDDTLVDTKQFSVNRLDLFNLEAAAVFGPLSYQGEVFYSLPGGGAEGTYQFWGWYVFGSAFMTGEHRRYNQSEGVFSRIEPKHDFRPLRGGWGAWELTGRFSYVDLNSKEIRGGKEGNLTLGLNGYLSRNLEVMANWIRVRVEDRDTHPQIGTGNADIYQVRFQIAF